MAGVVGELLGEDLHGAHGEASRAVRVSAGAAAAHERAELLDTRAGVRGSEAVADLLESRGERIEAMQARSALPGALLGEPARHARRLGHGTGML
jgi:hypothetical protein